MFHLFRRFLGSKTYERFPQTIYINTLIATLISNKLSHTKMYQENLMYPIHFAKILEKTLFFISDIYDRMESFWSHIKTFSDMWNVEFLSVRHI